MKKILPIILIISSISACCLFFYKFQQPKLYIEDVLTDFNLIHISTESFERATGSPPQNISDLVNGNYLPGHFLGKYKLVESGGIIFAWPSLSHKYYVKTSVKDRPYRNILSNSNIIMIDGKILFTSIDNKDVVLEAGSQGIVTPSGN